MDLVFLLHVVPPFLLLLPPSSAARAAGAAASLGNAGQRQITPVPVAPSRDDTLVVASCRNNIDVIIDELAVQPVGDPTLLYRQCGAPGWLSPLLIVFRFLI